MLPKTRILRVAISAVFLLCLRAKAQHPSSPSEPTYFEVGRHTFFDFGPPFNFYEIFIVRPTPSGTSIERITATPPGDACIQPAKVETASGVTHDSIGALLGTNPCSIPEKELKRVLKRCKKCLVFSGANISIRVRCGTATRIIRSDILDKDMFDSAPNTPKHTSWTMVLLEKLDSVTGPGVMESPVFFNPDGKEPSSTEPDSEAIRALSSGMYDALFQGAPDKPSGLYRAAQQAVPTPTVELMGSAPLRPELYIQPTYPPIARAAHIEGTVTFTIDVGADGSATNFTTVDGHTMLREAVQKAVADWKFPKGNATQAIHASIQFKLNCPAAMP